MPLKPTITLRLDATPDAPLDESEKTRQASEAERLVRREQIALAGGQLLGAAFSFVGQLLPPQDERQESRQMVDGIKQRLAECLEPDADGRLKLTVTLPDASALDDMATSLARLLAVRP